MSAKAIKLLLRKESDVFGFVHYCDKFSCKKEKSCEGSNGNKPPAAIAGPDQVITLPTDSISLSGFASNDPEGMISEWLWKKFLALLLSIFPMQQQQKRLQKILTGVSNTLYSCEVDGGLSIVNTGQIIISEV